jgi:adenylyltransferase/sulfurtransferase
VSAAGTQDAAPRDAAGHHVSAIGDKCFVLVGAGGLGSPLALALAGAGAGRIVLVDDDEVELSNLQRQILYRTEDVGRPKAVAAREALLRRGVAPTRVESIRARFDEDSARAIAHDADVVCDGSDNLDTKFLVNDACVALRRPFVIGAVLRGSGQVFPVRPGVDACYRCLFEDAPGDAGPTCADAGVLGAMCGVVAAWQARAAVALATGDDPAQILGRFFVFEHDARRSFAPRRRRECAACRAASPQEEVAS